MLDTKLIFLSSSSLTFKVCIFNSAIFENLVLLGLVVVLVELVHKLLQIIPELLFQVLLFSFNIVDASPSNAVLCIFFSSAFFLSSSLIFSPKSLTVFQLGILDYSLRFASLLLHDVFICFSIFFSIFHHAIDFFIR